MHGRVPIRLRAVRGGLMGRLQRGCRGWTERNARGGEVPPRRRGDTAVSRLEQGRAGGFTWGVCALGVDQEDGKAFMTAPDDFEGWLAGSLEDYRLSRTERQALADVLGSLGPGLDARELRRRAFDVARGALGEGAGLADGHEAHAV